MEILRSDPNEELASIGESDEFYEEMEAPKFVDFTIPDLSQPEDKSWFCLRIGCDQQHEEVDPDALYRSFMLRVMAARSPNIKLQKALDKQAPRTMKKCPRTAPEKSAKDRVSRLSTMTSIPDKMANAKLRNHPVSSLRSTPTKSESKVQPLSPSVKKAFTTPRNKKCPSIHESFLSVKHRKAPVAVPKNRNTAKALFLDTPKKNNEAGKLTSSEICDGMKKLNIGSLKKHTVKGNLRGKKAAESVSRNDRVAEIDVKENLPNSSVLILKESQLSGKNNFKSSDNSEEDSNGNTWANVDEFHDNKENDSSTSIVNSNTTNSKSESQQFETSKNIPQKETRAASKVIQEHNNQAGKVKRTTNPKPFRLRTNERGILKEANLEMKLKQAQRETALSVPRHGDVKHQNVTHEKKQQDTLEGQRSQPKQTRAPRVRYVESRYARGIRKCHKTENKETEESQNNVAKNASTRQILKAQSEISGRKVQVFQLKSATKSRVEDNTTNNTNAKLSKEKRPSAVQKETKFQRFHAPKSCTKRQGKVLP